MISENKQARQLLYIYIGLISFASAAIPYHQYYIKFDWIGMFFVFIYGVLLITQGAINKFSLNVITLYSVVLIFNGIVIFGQSSGLSNPKGYVSVFLQYFAVLCVFFVISSIRIRTEDLRRIMNLWVNIASIASILAIVQMISESIIVDGLLFIPYYEGGGIVKKHVAGVMATPAWFAEASWFGAFLVVPMTYTFHQLIDGKNSESQFFMLILKIILISLGFLFCYSLTAIISAFVGVVAVVVLTGRMNLPFIILISLTVGISYFYFKDSALIHLQVERFVELYKNIFDYSAGNMGYGTSTSFYQRSVGVSQGVMEFRENPVFGVGLGQGISSYDSGFIRLAVEQGVVGIILFITLPTIVIWKLFRIRALGRFGVNSIATILIAALIADYFNALITHQAFHPQRWLLLSIACGWLYSLQKRQKERANEYIGSAT